MTIPDTIPPLKIYFDGGCRPNPGRMEIAVVAGGAEYVVTDAGQGTSMDAEWLALLHAARTGLSLGPRPFVLLGDALAVITQARRSAKCPAAMTPHLEALRRLYPDGPPPIRYVKRQQNLAGIALARLHPR